MQRSELLLLIGDLTNDPNHDRYTASQIYTELDNSQDDWNIKAKIIKDTVTISTVSGTRQYALTGLTGTPIAFSRATHKGISLEKKDKSFFDLYSSIDWTTANGTPKYYYIETSDPDVQYINLYPNPADADAGTNLVVEYIKRHTTMASDSDQPFNASPLLTPYHWGLAYSAAARLLLRDPSAVNSPKAMAYNSIANNVGTDVVTTFKALEREEPYRIRGGRVWKY
jgi:hypothetical protein